MPETPGYEGTLQIYSTTVCRSGLPPLDAPPQAALAEVEKLVSAEVKAQMQLSIQQIQASSAETIGQLTQTAEMVKSQVQQEKEKREKADADLAHIFFVGRSGALRSPPTTLLIDKIILESLKTRRGTTILNIVWKPSSF